MTLHVSNKMLRVAAIAAATALALSACGKSEDKAGQQGGAAAGQQAPAPKSVALSRNACFKRAVM